MSDQINGGFLTSNGSLMTFNPGVSTAPLNMGFGYASALGGMNESTGFLAENVVERNQVPEKYINTEYHNTGVNKVVEMLGKMKTLKAISLRALKKRHAYEERIFNRITEDLCTVIQIKLTLIKNRDETLLLLPNLEEERERLVEEFRVILAAHESASVNGEIQPDSIAKMKEIQENQQKIKDIQATVFTHEANITNLENESKRLATLNEIIPQIEILQNLDKFDESLTKQISLDEITRAKLVSVQVPYNAVLNSYITEKTGAVKDKETEIWVEKNKGKIASESTQTLGDVFDLESRASKSRLSILETQLGVLYANLEVIRNNLHSSKILVDKQVKLSKDNIHQDFADSQKRITFIKQYASAATLRRNDVEKYVNKRKALKNTEAVKLDKLNKNVEKIKNQLLTRAAAMIFITTKALKDAKTQVRLTEANIVKLDESVARAESLRVDVIRDNDDVEEFVENEKEFLKFIGTESRNKEYADDLNYYNGGSEGVSPYVVDMSSSGVIGGAFATSFMVHHSIQGLIFGFFIVALIVCIGLSVWISYSTCLSKKAKCVLLGIVGITGAISALGSVSYGELYLEASPEKYQKSYEGNLYSAAKKMDV